MRILFVIHHSTFGGPHNQALRLATPLRARGIETVVLLPDEPGNASERLHAAGIEVLTMGLHRLRATPDPHVQLPFAAGFIPEVAKIARIVRDRRIDIVQVGGLVNPHAGIAGRAAGVPVVWQLLDTRAPRPLAFAAMLWVRTLATVVMTTGRKILAHFPGAEHVRGRLVPFIPPVDTEAFRPQPRLRAEVREEWGVPHDVPVVGSVANINPQKGIDVLIEAFARLRATLPTAHLVLVGSEYDAHEGYSRALRARMGELGLVEDREVHFLGTRPDVGRQLQGFDLFALASVPRSEGIPTVVLEAMASGLPVVATDVGGVSEVIDDGVTGRVVPPLDPAAFAAAASSVLHDATGRAEMVEAGRRRAVERFGVERCAEAHVRAYHLALAGGNSGG